ncbi:MAG TPA: hypothetical protein VNF68_05255 [Candidatus Baltobacteraceae bacterium]|nr:hypothetical protein [Candidatus Baltobacteraceae bacterium]
MSEWRQRGRRCGLVVVAIALATMLLRAQISSAFVTRGDDLSYSGNPTRSREMYERALLADPRNRVAADRYAFSAMMSHQMPLLVSAIAELDRALTREPHDLALRMDRGLCEQAAHRFPDAVRDFAYVGRSAHDPRALTFAALDVASVDRRRARAYLIEAVGYDPRFEPAVRDLHRFEKKRS